MLRPTRGGAGALDRGFGPFVVLLGQDRTDRLDAVARALHLTSDERSHLFAVAKPCAAGSPNRRAMFPRTSRK